MNCPSCGLPDWMIQTAPADVYCVHCGSTFHLLRSRAESIAIRQQLPLAGYFLEYLKELSLGHPVNGDLVEEIRGEARQETQMGCRHLGDQILGFSAVLPMAFGAAL